MYLVCRYLRVIGWEVQVLKPVSQESVYLPLHYSSYSLQNPKGQITTNALTTIVFTYIFFFILHFFSYHNMLFCNLIFLRGRKGGGGRNSFTFAIPFACMGSIVANPRMLTAPYVTQQAGPYPVIDTKMLSPLMHI